MAIIHMDVDAVTAFSQKMQQTHDEVEQLEQTMTNMVQQMVGSTWIAPVANEFLNTYQDKVKYFKNTQKALLDQKQRLDWEIDQWVETGSKMG